MSRRLAWMSFAAALTVASFSQPWTGSSAEAGPNGKAATTAPCGEVSSLRQELATAQAENRRLQAELDKAVTAERKRAKRLEDQLGAANQAARDAARAQSLGRSASAAARDALPGWVQLNNVSHGSCSDVCVQVEAGVPVGWPGFMTITHVPVTRDAVFVRHD